MSLKTLQDFEELKSEYAALPDQLEKALEGLSEHQLDIRPAGGRWSIRETVHHLADADLLSNNIIVAALGNPGCTYDQTWYSMDNRIAGPLGYADRPTGPALELFRVAHRRQTEMLNHIGDAADKSLTLKFEKSPEGKNFTVHYLLHSQTHHARHHIRQILDIRAGFPFAPA